MDPHVGSSAVSGHTEDFPPRSCRVDEPEKTAGYDSFIALPAWIVFCQLQNARVGEGRPTLRWMLQENIDSDICGQAGSGYRRAWSPQYSGNIFFAEPLHGMSSSGYKARAIRSSTAGNPASSAVTTTLRTNQSRMQHLLVYSQFSQYGHLHTADKSEMSASFSVGIFSPVMFDTTKANLWMLERDRLAASTIAPLQARTIRTLRSFHPIRPSITFTVLEFYAFRIMRSQVWPQIMTRQ